jgi:Sulfotransferase family
MGLLRPIEIGLRQFLTRTRWVGNRLVSGWSDPSAVDFYDTIAAHGFEFDNLIKLVPSLGVIYIVVPKVASTRIKLTLAEAVGRRSIQFGRRQRRFRGPRGPSSMTLGAFHRLATNPKTLRFSFVRNPYARAVSCWADKWQGKLLVPGDDFVDGYLRHKHQIDADLPAGPEHTLSFADFVTYASALANRRLDAHLQAQYDILAMPGIKLDFVGRIERFSEDIVPVLDHIGAVNGIRSNAVDPVNPSRHGPWADYYTPALRDRIYRAYERDFDLFQYPRACKLD